MDKITLKEYAERLGKDHVTAAQRAARGSFRTAEKIGRQWFIDPNEEWVDNRIRNGNYVGWREAHEKAD